MRLALEAPATGGKRDKGVAATPAKKKAPVTGAKAGKGAASGGGKKKRLVLQCEGGQTGAVLLVKKEGKSNFPPLARCVIFESHSELGFQS